MYQRPRKLAEFDIRVARAFSFIVGAILVGYGFWGLGGIGDNTTAIATLRIMLVLMGAWCLYVAVFNRVKALKEIEPDGNVDLLLSLVLFAVFIVSFLVALVVPDRSDSR